jgi:hypothetical protein
VSVDADSIEAALTRVEEARMGAWRTSVLLFGGGALGAFVAAYLLADFSGFLSMLLGWAGLGWFMIGFLGPGRIARAAFKRELTPLALARVDPGLHYDEQGISKEEFCATALFEGPSQFASKDTVRGRIGEVPVRFAMVQATRTRDRSVVVCFQGLFFIADFNKHFSGRTRVRLRDWSFIGALDDAEVELEDPRFAKAFAVDSTDQVEARYLLTPDFCERLLALNERYRPVAALLEGGNLTLALGMGYDALDGIPGETLDLEQFERMVEKYKEVAALTGHLELDTRIWSKRGYATAP